MNIALFTDTYLPDINGVVTSVNLLYKKLKQDGHNCYVITNHNGFSTILDEDIIMLPGIEIKSLYGYKLSSPINISLINKIKQLNLDIIHVHTEFGVGIIGTKIAKKLNIPLIRTYHTTYEDYTHYLNVLNLKVVEKLEKKIVAKFSCSLANDSNCMIAPSIKTQNMLLDYGVDKNKIKVIPTGIELKKFNKENTTQLEIAEIREKYNIKKEDFIFIFVGRIAKEKSIDFIINSFANVDHKLKENVKFLIVGDGPYIDELKSITNKLNLNNRVIFAGKVAFESIEKYYHASNCFISASTSETQGMTYVEALSSKTLVCAKYDDALKDLIIDRENGFFFTDQKSLDDLLVEVSSISKDNIDKIIENGYNSSKIYDSDVFKDSVLNLYNDILSDYNSSFVVKGVKLEKDYVCLDIISSKFNIEQKIDVSIDDYMKYGLRINQQLDNQIITYLKSKQNVVCAYQKVLNKLAIKEYTIKEIYDYLINNYDLNIKDVNDIVDKLKSINLLDDEKYLLNKLSFYSSTFVSKNKIINNLKLKGISIDLIKKHVDSYFDKDKQLIIALNIANKVLKSNKSKSIKACKNNIYLKLSNEGFDKELINETLEQIDFSNLILLQSDNLEKDLKNAYKKYKNKYTSTNLRNKIFTFLLNKGYNYDNIYIALNKKELIDEND